MLNQLPLECLNMILAYCDVKDLGRMQAINRSYYNFVMRDSQFTLFNTLKFFEVYYKKRMLALFLLPYVDPRYQYQEMAVQDDFDDAATVVIHDDAADHNQEASKRQHPQGPGNTIVHIVASSGLVEELKAFKQFGMYDRVRVQQTSYNETCQGRLKLQEVNRHCSVVSLLNDEPNTPLHYISIIPEEVDHATVLSVASYLVKMGADIWMKGRAGNTCLAEAAQHGQEEMVEFFLHVARNQASSAKQVKDYINEYNNYSENSVIMAARSSPRILSTLLQNGGDVNSARHGYPILAIASSNFRLDRRDPNNFTTYHHQRTSRYSIPWPSLPSQDTEPLSVPPERHIEVIKILLAFNADPLIAERGTGMTALHIASFWGVVDAVRLLSAVINVNQHENITNGWTPMHYACVENQISSILALADAGANMWDADQNSMFATRQNVPAPLSLLHLQGVKTSLLSQMAVVKQRAPQR